MKLANYQDVTLEEVNIDGAKDVKIRWLISEDDKAPNFAMRLFEVQPNGHTPYHKHDWEHEVFIIEGKGILKTKTGEKKFSTGDAIFVDPQKYHNFTNTGESILRFLCVIPHQNKPKKKKNANPFASGKANNC